MENIKILEGEVNGYKLLDSGDKEKLEEIGGKRIVRKEPRAWWKKTTDSGQNFAETSLSKQWVEARKEQKNGFETVLNIDSDGVKAKIKYKENSKHIGIFPEQAAEWKWIEEKIASSKQIETGEIKVLNLFGYTGIASLIAAKAGLSSEASAKWRVKVTHVDASKQSVDWARENQKLSGLEGAPIKWIVEDAVKFIKKEIKRGVKYDAIIMDPPSYGRGPKGEVWKIEDKLQDLLKSCREILSDDPLFVIFNMYSTELSSISVANLLSDMMEGLGGKTEAGELTIKQENSNRLLPMSIFAIWEK